MARKTTKTTPEAGQGSAPLAPVSGVDQPPWEHRGHNARHHRWARPGWYEPGGAGAPSTTRQAEILNTALIGPPTGARGIVNGRDVLSRTTVAHDPITAYNTVPREISSPNVIVMGTVGAGKSTFVKTVFVLRPMLLQNRRAVIFDKKSQGDEGEYAGVVRRYGAEPIRFSAATGGSRLNLLDPRITAATGLQGQLRLLDTVVRLGRGDQALTEWELEALSAALARTLAGGSRRTPVLADVLPQLGVIDGDNYRELSAEARDQLHQAGLSVRWTLNSLLREYGGMLDGETSDTVDLAGKLTSFDLSQLPDDGPAVPVAMAVANMWLLGRLREERGYRTNVIYEEGWHLLGGPSAHLIKSNQKLSRALGISNIFVMHKGTDIPPDSPGITILQEAQSIYVYRQDRPEDATWCAETFGFSPDTASTIERLRDGHFIFKFGTHPETQVQHVRSDWEIAVTETDEGLAGGAG